MVGVHRSRMLGDWMMWKDRRKFKDAGDSDMPLHSLRSARSEGPEEAEQLGDGCQEVGCAGRVGARWRQMLGTWTCS